MREIIRDAQNKPIGFIETYGTISRLFDKTGGVLLATYNKSTNLTLTSSGRLVGRGNLLMTQIKG